MLNCFNFVYCRSSRSIAFSHITEEEKDTWLSLTLKFRMFRTMTANRREAYNIVKNNILHKVTISEKGNMQQNLCFTPITLLYLFTVNRPKHHKLTHERKPLSFHSFSDV